jgi:cytoskeleton protein RodZ
MDDVATGASNGPAPSLDAKTLLMNAREASGLSLADVATRTRVPIRHLEALESGDYSGLPSPTYAVGFARAYARAAGADEVEVARLVRADLDRIGPRTPEYVPYETADPARVPSRGIAIVGAGLALAVLILVVLFYGTNLFSGTGSSNTAAPEVAAVTPNPVPTAQPTPTPPTGGNVTLTATDDVWLRVYDADNKTLYLGTMKPGDRYDVPAEANDPMINVGRPDKLDVTLNGSKVPPLGTGERAIKDVRVSGAAIAARLNGTPAPAASPSATPTSSSSAISSTGARSSTPTRRTARSTPTPEATASATPPTDTQRANLEAAQALEKPGN